MFTSVVVVVGDVVDHNLHSQLQPQSLQPHLHHRPTLNSSFQPLVSHIPQIHQAQLLLQICHLLGRLYCINILLLITSLQRLSRSPRRNPSIFLQPPHSLYLKFRIPHPRFHQLLLSQQSNQHRLSLKLRRRRAKHHRRFLLLPVSV